MTLSKEHKDHIRAIMDRPLSDFMALGYGLGVALAWAEDEFDTIPEVLDSFFDQIDRAGQEYLDSLA